MSTARLFELALLEATVMALTVLAVEVSYHYLACAICVTLCFGIYTIHHHLSRNSDKSLIHTTSSGAGNIADIGTPTTERKDVDIIPETAVRPSQDGRDYHTGRGGAGNAQTAGSEKESEEHEKPAVKTPVGLADKLKSKIFGHKK